MLQNSDTYSRRMKNTAVQLDSISGPSPLTWWVLLFDGAFRLQYVRYASKYSREYLDKNTMYIQTPRPPVTVGHELY